MNQSLANIASGRRVNIDTVEFSVVGVKWEPDNVSKIAVESPNGEFRFSKTNRIPVFNDHSSHKLHVRFKKGSTDVGELFVEGALYAFRYGQNVHTSSNLKVACIRTLRRLQELLGFEVEDGAWERWRSGDIALGRVDLAINFELESPEQVADFVRQFGRQAVEQGSHVVVRDKSVSWLPKNGSEYSITLYDKGRQMLETERRYHDDAILTRLVEESANLLRVEVRLRRAELKRNGLHFVSGWSTETARTVYEKYFGRLPVFDVASGPLTAQDLGVIPERLRPVYALHKAGVDVGLCYSTRTMSRHRASFRAHGIDLKCPSQPAPATSVVALLRDSGKARTPKWLIDAGKAPPRKRKVAKPKGGRATRRALRE